VLEWHVLGGLCWGGMRWAACVGMVSGRGHVGGGMCQDGWAGTRTPS